MKEKKNLAVITIKCDDKEELKSVLNYLKDAVVPVMHNPAEEESEDKEPEAFRPKKGDICTYVEVNEPTAIFRYNGNERIDKDGCRMFDSDLSLGYSGNILQPYFVVKGGDQVCPADECRLATEEEINLFQAYVKEYEENEKDAVWVARKGGNYWTPSFDYNTGEFDPTETHWEGKCMEIYTNRRGWTFRRKEGCQLLCDKLNEAIRPYKDVGKGKK